MENFTAIQQFRNLFLSRLGLKLAPSPFFFIFVFIRSFIPVTDLCVFGNRAWDKYGIVNENITQKKKKKPNLQCFNYLLSLLTIKHGKVHSETQKLIYKSSSGSSSQHEDSHGWIHRTQLGSM